MIERNAAHDYWRTDAPDTKYPSVTTIIDAAFGKPGLVPWARRHAIEFTLAAQEAQQHDEAWLGVPLDKIANKLETAATRDAMAKADLGDRVHKAVERYVKERMRVGWEAGIIASKAMLGEDVTAHIDQLMCFERDYGKPRWVASEIPLLDTAHGYGGTADALGYFADEPDELTLVDFKTGKLHDAEHVLQLSGYWPALIAAGYPVDRAAILQLTDKGYKWKPMKISQADIDAFYRCVENYRWLTARAL